MFTGDRENRKKEKQERKKERMSRHTRTAMYNKREEDYAREQAAQLLIRNRWTDRFSRLALVSALVEPDAIAAGGRLARWQPPSD